MSTTRDPRVNHQEGDRLSMDGDVYVVTRRTASAAVLLVASREVQS